MIKDCYTTAFFFCRRAAAILNIQDKIISQYAYNKNEQPEKQIAVFQ